MKCDFSTQSSWGGVYSEVLFFQHRFLLLGLLVAQKSIMSLRHTRFFDTVGTMTGKNSLLKYTNLPQFTEYMVC